MRAFTMALCGLLAVLWLSGCAPRHPLGIPDEQWQTMSLEQQLQARERQAELDRARAEQRAKEAQAREAEAARQLAELEQQRRDARYGERVQCVLSSAEARLNRQWRPVEPLALDLVRGFELPFELQQSDGRPISHRGRGYALFDGQIVTLCPQSGQHASRPVACLRLLGTLRDYHSGLDQTLAAPDFLRGRLRCHLVPGVR